MHLHGSGEANRFPRQPFDSCTEREMLAFDPLGLPFAREVLRRFQLPRIRAPVIGGKPLDPKRWQELLAVVCLSSFDDRVPLTRGTPDRNDCHATLLNG